MKTIINLAVVLLLSVTFSFAADTLSEIDKAILELAPKIGSFPPEIGGAIERDRIEKKYGQLKKIMDEELTKHPNDITLLYKRGFLQYMGNNLGNPEAFKGCENDLTAVIKSRPDFEPALVTLGSLYISSHRSLASKAEALFLSAQKKHGSEPLEGAQQGLFLTYYYQGEMELALEKAQLLVKLWPSSDKYRTYEKMAQTGLERTKKN